MLRTSMHYPAVKDMTGHRYVEIISQDLVTLFFSALYKCPRVRDMHRFGIVPRGSTHLHRFLPVPKVVYDKYGKNASLDSKVAFYCFQSFSLSLSGNSIVPFSQPSPANTHLILLRIRINQKTSARYISHYSAVEREDEVLALPCVPYSIIGKTALGSGIDGGQKFAEFIRDHSGFNCATHGIVFQEFAGYLIITLEEELYQESMQREIEILNG